MQVKLKKTFILQVIFNSASPYATGFQMQLPLYFRP
jgi:hypothetical protein